MLTFTKHNQPSQIPVDSILLSFSLTVVKISTVQAIHYQKGRTMIYVKGGKFIEVAQDVEQHLALMEEYTTKLQATLPNR